MINESKYRHRALDLLQEDKVQAKHELREKLHQMRNEKKIGAILSSVFKI